MRVALVKIPPRSPNLNAYAEWSVRTIKESYLERMILLRLDNVLISPDPGHTVVEGKVHRRERLGGLLNYYYRKAA